MWLKPFVPEDAYGIAEAYNLPRQQLPQAFVQNGSVDVIRTQVMTEEGSMTGHRIRAFVMNEDDSINIDSPLDWAMAERLLKQGEGH